MLWFKMDEISHQALMDNTLYLYSILIVFVLLLNYYSHSV